MYLNDATRLYEEEEDSRGIASVLRKQAAATVRTTDFVKARTIATTALEHCRTLVQCLDRIGAAQMCKGQELEALSTLDEAVALASRSGDRPGPANTLHAVGFTQTRLSDFAKAAEALSEAITIARNIGWEGGLSVTLNSMGSLKMWLGDYDASEELFQESIPIARRVRDRHGGWRGWENASADGQTPTKLLRGWRKRAYCGRNCRNQGLRKRSLPPLWT